jgi:signal transduction histidine kinase
VTTDPAADVLDALPDGAVIADGEGQVVRVNAMAARMLGVEASAAVGAPLAEVLRLQDTEGCTWVGLNTPYAGLASRTGVPEQPWLLPDGTEVLVVARIHRTAGEIDTVALTLRSGRGRARLDRERSDLVATVAHELRSPLTGVKGFVQVLLNRWDHLSDEQKKLMLTTVHSDSDRLSRLIAELLDVARIDTGRLQLYVRPADVAALAARVVDSVSQSTARNLVLDIERGLPPLQADPDKFVQVLTNLVENAVRHGDGTVLVTVRGVPDADDPAIAITVEDEGAGIPEEIRRRVFTKFWKHGASGGSGLGMYLVNGLVRAHGGQVEIGDAPGGGARVSIVWPAAG